MSEHSIILVDVVVVGSTTQIVAGLTKMQVHLVGETLPSDRKVLDMGWVTLTLG